MFNPPPPGPELECDDEDAAALQKAIELSLQPPSPGENQKSTLPLEADKASPKRQTATTTFGSLMLDRKQMEEERLARMKRKASGLGQSQRHQQKVKLDGPMASPEPQVPASASNQPTSTGSSPPSHAGLKYPDGAIKRTWAFGYPRNNDIKIEEVLQKSDLELAVLSSYQWDDEWMMSKFDLAKTKIICIAYAAEEAQVS
jgi:hypothetical protein